MERSNHGLLKALHDSVNKHSAERAAGRNDHLKRLRENVAKNAEELERVKEKKLDDLSTMVSTLAEQSTKKQSELEAQMCALTQLIAASCRDTKSLLTDSMKNMADDINMVQTTAIRELEEKIGELKTTIQAKDSAMEDLNARYEKLVSDLVTTADDNDTEALIKLPRAASVNAKSALDHLYKTYKPPRKRQK